MNFSMWTQKLNKWKHLKGQDWLIVILLGVLLLIIAIPTGGMKKDSAATNDEKKEKEESSTQLQDAALSNRKAYVKELEQELKETLSQMQGVGDVKVMITLQDEGESVVDKDTTNSSESKQESTVIFEKGSDRIPYVTKNVTPKVEGVVVVAEGGGNAKTASQISDAVMALFQIEPHKIKVIQMKTK